MLLPSADNHSLGCVFLCERNWREEVCVITYEVNWPLGRVSEADISSDGGTSALETLYGGQVTLSTQVIEPFCFLMTTKMQHQFLWELTPVIQALSPR